MFLIGQFAAFARVSARQLRHWDQLGLLTPEHVDDATGYRMYRASQLPRLHRILALKDLGFRLEEVGRLVDDEVGVEELRGMLELKRSQAQSVIEDEQMRLRSVEARIAALANPRPDDEVRLTSLAGGIYVSHRFMCDGPMHGIEVFGGVAGPLMAEFGPQLGHPIAFAHSDPFEDSVVDLEMGWLRPELPAGLLEFAAAELGVDALRTRAIAPVEEAVVTIRRGDPRIAHEAYSSLLRWMDLHGRSVAGPLRESFAELPADPSRLEDSVVELQVPVTAATS